MEYRSLGGSGLRVSLAGLGCNNFGMRIDADQSSAVVDAALDAGITLFDTARSYSHGRSEEILGHALKGRREGAVIATKFGGPTTPRDATGSRGHIIRSVEASLTALQTDYIDLFQLHYPDAATPIWETLAALDALVKQGKVRYLGCSNFAGWMIADAHWTAQAGGFERFVSVQNEWSLLARDIEREVTSACEHLGASVVPYFPLASGFLTGKVKRGEQPPASSRLSTDYFGAAMTDTNFDRVERLGAWAQRQGRTMVDVALSWLASQTVVGSVIAGATSVEQVRANAASTRSDLTGDQVSELGALLAA